VRGELNMTRAIVAGSLGFLGFELCSVLLEEGFEVLAVDQQDEAGERWLEVGRNANITYQPLHQASTDVDGRTIFYINLYDLLTEDKKGKQSFYDGVKNVLGKSEKRQVEAVVLVPTVLSQRINEKELSRFLKFLDDEQFDIQSKVYVPTLIGPHQPETFLFQQLITNEVQASHYIDDTRNAIFVRDAAHAIINKIIESKDYRLVSSTPDSWQKTHQLLDKGQEAGRREKQNTKNICPEGLTNIKVEPSSTLEEIIEFQRNI
jgi:nucleoside-diphosphate-sugar epimerase